MTYASGVRASLAIVVVAAGGAAACGDAAEEDAPATSSTTQEWYWRDHGKPDRDRLVVPIHERVGGRTYAEWGAKLWKTVYAEPRANNPIEDPDGTHCAERQPRGKVWFLHRNFGGTTERWCTIPHGKYLFVPLVDAFNDYPCPDPSFKPGPRQSLRRFLTDGYGSIPGANDLIDPFTILGAEIDGKAIPNVASYRSASRLVHFEADASWQALDPCVTGKRQKAVAAGYWLMLKPLPPGPHDLHFHAERPDCAIDVTYHLYVEPRWRQTWWSDELDDERDDERDDEHRITPD